MARPFIRQEAVLSSKIEGTRTTLDELYSFEATQSTRPASGSDALEVENYVRALDFGIERLNTLPVSLRLIRELHEHLFHDVRGEHLTPGEFRRSQNWVGPPGSTLETATYVPPPVEEMHLALNHLERFIHAGSDLPPLIRLGLIHYQFEAIHPFLDGNGRIGRLLISLLLCEWQLLTRPFLYLSAHFESSRPEYYARLLAVSEMNDWAGWLAYFLVGVAHRSREAMLRIDRLMIIRDRYRQLLQKERAAERLLRVVDFLIGQPIVTVRQVQHGIQASDFKVAQRYVDKLLDKRVLREVSGRARNRLYRADEIMLAIQEPLD